MQRNAAKLLLGGLFVVCVFRAITQSIVYDEAETYELYIAAPFSAIFTYFDASHHFFSTLLIRLSTALFGISEWSMRLPALAGALLWMWALMLLYSAFSAPEISPKDLAMAGAFSRYRMPPSG
jgi:hypothetical protein